MKTKTFSIVVGAFMALTGTATACYYYAWPPCPQSYSLSVCPDGSGWSVSHCDSTGGSFAAAQVTGGPHDSRYCGTKLVTSNCRYLCFYNLNGEEYVCGTLTNSVQRSAPDPQTGVCPDNCPGQGS